MFTAGAKYEFSKFAVGASYLNGRGYSPVLIVEQPTDRVKALNAYSIGGAYTWCPGLTTNVDGVLFEEKIQGPVSNDGYVLLVSQKLAF